MLNTIITSKTRVKLLLKFFFNPDNISYLRELAEEFGESTNGIRVELNKLTEAQLLKAEKKGRKVVYKANKSHTLFKDIRSMVMKTIGIDEVVNNILKRVGEPDLAFITGDYARGIDSGLIDLVIIGEVNVDKLKEYKETTESLIKRKIRILILDNKEYKKLERKFLEDGLLIIWKKQVKRKKKNCG
ncbi:winged helix-turn-helix transcriptional regulator [bacterium]|nr:winged helix-turn-helix transcriptional regulator [bacterium]